MRRLEMSQTSLIKNQFHPWMLPGKVRQDEFEAFKNSYESYPLQFYCPNGKQEEFINTVAHCNENVDTPVVLVTFGNGTGKTTASIHILMNIIYGPQNGWFDYPLFKSYPYPKEVWYCSTADALKTKVVPEIEKLAYANTYAASKGGKPYTSEFQFENGWYLHLKTFDQDPKTFESADVGLVILDEPAPEHIWKAIKSRRRMGCIVLLPMTPLFCDPYIIDEVAGGVDEGKKGYFHLEAEVYDACMKRGVRGHLKAGIIDSMVADYDQDELEARAKGKFMYFARSIYGNSISREKHFVNPEDYPIDDRASILHVVDPHDGRYSASIWMAINPDGRRIIFDEYPNDKSRSFWDMQGKVTTSEEVRSWAQKESNYPVARNIRRILDRRFGWQTRGDTNFASLYSRAGFRVGKKFNFIESYSISGQESEIQYGHRMVREAFRDMADQKPGLVIWNTCFHTWNGLSHYIRKMEVSKSASEKAVGTGKIVEKYKDFPDVVRYGVCAHIAPQLTKHEKWEKEMELLAFGPEKKVVRW